MPETVIMPKLGFDMAEGTLVRWVISEGETVDKGSILAEIETDKATVEVESNFSGKVAQHLVQPGDIVPINTPIAIIASPGEDIDKALMSVQSQERGATSPASDSKKGPVEGVRNAEQDQSETSESSKLPGGLRASPLARRMAKELGVSLTQIMGSGLKGRIVAKDVNEYLSAPARRSDISRPEPELTIQPGSDNGTVKLTEATDRTGRRITEFSPLPTEAIPADQILKPSKLRAAIGRRMVEAKQQIPHFYVTRAYHLDALLTLRKQINEILPEEQRVSINDFIVKAAALCLRQFPNLNASLNDEEIIQHGSINIGVAVAVEGGLLTVVCREADRKNLRVIANEVRAMARRARDLKVRPEDIEGSTFSLSNLGMFEVENFSAIINPPEVAILAVSSAQEIPVIKDGQISAGWRMKATISVDHRVSDGAEAARFMQALAPYLEQPLSLLV